MPTETFFNLSNEKRQRFIEVSLIEFSQNNFDTASINRIIKNLGIARGSVYQYFTDKLDLWLYLKEYAENIKIENIKSVKRDDFASFWDYYRELYSKGIDFDIKKPYCSKFLYRISFKENCAEVNPYLESWKKKAKSVISTWVEHEKEIGTFSKENSTEIISHFLMTASMSIADLLQDKYKLNFDSNLRQSNLLYGNNKTEIMSAINELIHLFEKSLK